jgi:hypothetical protein
MWGRLRLTWKIRIEKYIADILRAKIQMSFMLSDNGVLWVGDVLKYYKKEDLSK